MRTGSTKRDDRDTHHLFAINPRTHNGLSFDNVIDLQERGQIHFSELYAVRARRSVR